MTELKRCPECGGVATVWKRKSGITGICKEVWRSV